MPKHKKIYKVKVGNFQSRIRFPSMSTLSTAVTTTTTTTTVTITITIIRPVRCWAAELTTWQLTTITETWTWSWTGWKCSTNGRRSGTDFRKGLSHVTSHISNVTCHMQNVVRFISSLLDFHFEEMDPTTFYMWDTLGLAWRSGWLSLQSVAPRMRQKSVTSWRLGLSHKKCSRVHFVSVKIQ